MRIEAIAQQSFKPVSPSGFREGAKTTAEKIISLIATILVAATSFFLLPAEAAATLSAGLVVLFTTFCCASPEERGQQIFNARRGHPVAQPGARVAVGEGHNRVGRAIHAQAEVHPAVRHHPNAVQVILQDQPQRAARVILQDQPQPRRQHAPVARQEVPAQQRHERPPQPAVQPQLNQQPRRQHARVGRDGD